MLSPRSVVLLLVAFVASTAQAFMMQAAGKVGLQRAATSSPWHQLESCPCMSCRTNLKKEKRQRNRINAFRFKKGGFTKRRFFGPDYAADQKKADEKAASASSGQTTVTTTLRLAACGAKAEEAIDEIPGRLVLWWENEVTDAECLADEKCTV